MEAHSKSFLSRCRNICFGSKSLSSREARSTTRYVVQSSVHIRQLTIHRSWPRVSSSCSVQLDPYEDDLTLILEETHDHTSAMPRRRRSLTTASIRSPRIQSLTVPPWCRLPTSTRFTILLVAMLFLTSQTLAAPLQYEIFPKLAERQSVPDQFGNTGNRPAPADARPSQQAANPSSTSPNASIRTISIGVSATAIISSVTTVQSPTSTANSPSPEETTLFRTASFLGPFFTPRPTNSPPGTNPENQLQRVEPQNILSPASIAGIVLGGVILIILTLLSIFLCRRRRKAREIREISIRRSKIGSRLANRVFGQHYDENIARSRSKKVKQPKYPDDSVASWGNVRKEMSIEPPPPSIRVTNPPISPSIYSPRRLTRATRISTMTFGSVSGWLDKAAIGRPPAPAFTGTPSQLLDAPKPLFAKEQKGSTEASWRGDISPPRPARPGSAEPLGRLSGMGFGLGMR